MGLSGLPWREGPAVQAGGWRRGWRELACLAGGGEGWRLWAEGWAAPRGGLRPLWPEPRTRSDSDFAVSAGLSPVARPLEPLTLLVAPRPCFSPVPQSPFSSPSVWSHSSPLLSLSLFPVPSVCRPLAPGFPALSAPHRAPTASLLPPQTSGSPASRRCCALSRPVLSPPQRPRPWPPCIFCLSVSTTRTASPRAPGYPRGAARPPCTPPPPTPEPRFPTCTQGCQGPTRAQGLACPHPAPTSRSPSPGAEPAWSRGEDCSSGASWASPAPGARGPEAPLLGAPPHVLPAASLLSWAGQPRRWVGREGTVGEGRPVGAPEDKARPEWGGGRGRGVGPGRQWTLRPGPARGPGWLGFPSRPGNLGREPRIPAGSSRFCCHSTPRGPSPASCRSPACAGRGGHHQLGISRGGGGEGLRTSWPTLPSAAHPASGPATPPGRAGVGRAVECPTRVRGCSPPRRGRGSPAGLVSGRRLEAEAERRQVRCAGTPAPPGLAPPSARPSRPDSPRPAPER